MSLTVHHFISPLDQNFHQVLSCTSYTRFSPSFCVPSHSLCDAVFFIFNPLPFIDPLVQGERWRCVGGLSGRARRRTAEMDGCGPSPTTPPSDIAFLTRLIVRSARGDGGLERSEHVKMDMQIQLNGDTSYPRKSTQSWIDS